MKFEIVQRGDEWVLLDAEGNQIGDPFDTYQDALGEVDRLMRAHLAQGDAETEGTSSGRFRALLAPEGVETSDGRLLEAGALEPRDTPLPLMLQTKTDIGHFGAELAARIDSWERKDGKVWGYGDLDTSDAGQQARQILDEHGRFGISIDVGKMDADFECTEEDEDGYCIDGLLTVHKAEVLGATMTPFPAFAEAYIELDGAQPETETEEESETEASVTPITAAIPVDPPAEWFEDPGLTELTPIHVTDDGRIFGHAAPWNECHIGLQGRCVIAPKSQTDYAYFRTGALKPAECDCDQLSVGVITMNTIHPDLSMGAYEAARHYSDTGLAAADVMIGHDVFGIWVAGAVRPGLTPEELRVLRASSLSGDWRPIGGSSELVALLAVNVPGFPVPRVKAHVASGEPVALVAAGATALARLKEQENDPVTKRMADFEKRLAHVERVAGPLRKTAQRSMVASISGD